MKPSTRLCLLAAAVLGTACGDGGTGVAAAPCAEVTCSSHGSCTEDDGSAKCVCSPGYHADGLSCVDDAGGPCSGVTCSGHGSCSDSSGSAVCHCDPGYHSNGLTCVPDAPDPCEGVACSGHGACDGSEGPAICRCHDGYHPVGLTCVADQGNPCDGVGCAGHGTCSASAGTAVCNCEQGYEANGLACERSATGETDCSDGLDGDGDGPVDCADPDCETGSCASGCVCTGGVGKELLCADGVDNDGDGGADFLDSDCSTGGTGGGLHPDYLPIVGSNGITTNFRGLQDPRSVVSQNVEGVALKVLSYEAISGSQGQLKFFLPPGTVAFDANLYLFLAYEEGRGALRLYSPPTISLATITPEMVTAPDNIPNGNDYSLVFDKLVAQGEVLYYTAGAPANFLLLSSPDGLSPALASGGWVYGNFQYPGGQFQRSLWKVYVKADCYERWFDSPGTGRDASVNPAEGDSHTCD
jgi:hypothetical protein